MTRKAERVFVGAFDNQWIEQTENGFKWIGFGKTKENGLAISRTRKLAYLCHKIFGDNVPWEDIETFFGERKLSRDWGNIDGNKREHQPWMYKIDHLIDNEEKKMKLNETP